MSPTSTNSRRRPDETPDWYKDAIFYEVRARSYFDSNGDGIGDLAGLTAKLDYLSDLGIDALWILPHYPSPGRDDGYDIADYTNVHPDLGTLDDFDRLIEEAHARGIRVVTELVLNHTSDQHPWFREARQSPPGSPARERYVWTDDPEKYRDARIIFRDFEHSNWTWDPVAKAYYWHRFYAHQPDLNFENPEVGRAMLAVVDFWFRRGVDGLRLDAVPYLFEEEGTNCENLPATHAFLRELRAHVDRFHSNRMLLAEANQWPEDAARYFGSGDECHMCFHFPIMPRLFMALHMEDRFPIVDILEQTPELPAGCQWAMFLRNHDELTLEMVTDEERDAMYRAYANDPRMRINLGIRRRLAPLVGNDRRKMELLNGLLFSLPGAPVLYYGDEIGMGDNVYLGDRNGVRTPMQWSADRNAGFSRANPQRLILPIVIDPGYHYEALHVEGQQENPSSLLWWTKRQIALRKKHRAFARGALEMLRPSSPRVLAFLRRHEDETLLVVANLSRQFQHVSLDLPSVRGLVPVELAGRTALPAITAEPLQLTLGPFAFYWFSLESGGDAASRISREPLPMVDVGREGPFGAGFASALVGYLASRDALSGEVSEARVEGAIEVGDARATVLGVDYVGGERDAFVVPWARAAKQHAEDARAFAAAGRREGSGEAAQVLLDDTEGFARALGIDARGAHSAASPSALVQVVVLAVEQEPALEAPWSLLSSSKERSVHASSGLVLELSRRLVEGESPAVQVARALGGTGLVPRVFRAVEYVSSRGTRSTLALVREYVEGEGNLHDFAMRDVSLAYERALASDLECPAQPSASLLHLAHRVPPTELSELLTVSREWAVRFGRRTAALHAELSRSTEPDLAPVPYTTFDRRSRYQSSRNAVGRFLDTLEAVAKRGGAGWRLDVQSLLEREADMLAVFAPLLDTPIDACRIRIHGRLELSCVLRTSSDFVFTDFAPSSSGSRASALRDVARLVRSLDEAAHEALLLLRPEDRGRATAFGEAWASWTSAAFVAGYSESATGSTFVPSRPETTSLLLETALVESALVQARVELERGDDDGPALVRVLRSFRRESDRSPDEDARAP